MINFGNATLHVVDGNEMAVYDAARAYANANGMLHLMGHVGEQSGRAIFSTSILAKEFLHFTREHSLVSGKGADYAKVEDFEQVTQRAVVPGHVKEIADYLRTKISTGAPIVFPGVVLNCDEAQATLFIRKGGAKRQFAVLCIDEDAPLSLIDGMHRKYAFKEVLEPKKLERLDSAMEQDIKNLLLSAMVTFEGDRKQLRNDFAVIAQAMPISNSVQIAFRRNGINDFTTEALKAIKFLHHHTNTVSVQTGPRSAHAWTLSVVSRAMRVMVNGDRSDNEAALTEKLDAARTKVLAGGLGFDDFVLGWWNAIENAFPVYRDMAKADKPEANFMAEMRARDNGANQILLGTSGLELLALVGHDLWRRGWATQERIDKRVAFLSGFDWKPENPAWLQNLIPYLGAPVAQSKEIVIDASVMLLDRCYANESVPREMFPSVEREKRKAAREAKKAARKAA